MSVPEAEFTAGTGPDRLPAGEATDLNAGLAVAESVAPVAPPVADPRQRLSGIEFADGSEEALPPSGDPMDEVLFGPAEGLGRGRPVLDVNARVPQDVVRNLPLLQRAAADPQSPPALVAAMRLIERQMQRQGR